MAISRETSNLSPSWETRLTFLDILLMAAGGKGRRRAGAEGGGE